MVSRQAASVSGVLQDFKLIDTHDPEVDLVREFLMQARDALKMDPCSLMPQLRGCMTRITADSVHALTNSMLDACDAALAETSRCLLVPVFPCFPSPSAPCKTKLWNLVDMLCLERSSSLAVVKTKVSHVTSKLALVSRRAL